MIKKKVKIFIKTLIKKTGVCRSLESEKNNLEKVVYNLKKEKENLKHLINNLKAENKSVKNEYLEIIASEIEIQVFKDYSDLTIIVPYRKTNDPEREENMNITLSYLSKIGINNLIISEHATKTSQKFLIDKYGNLFDLFRVIFSKSDDNLFNKAHAINQGVIASNTPYFAIVDMDCLTEKKNIDLAIHLLEKGFEVVHPFNRVIKDIIDKESFRKNFDFQSVTSTPQYRDWADGGIVFWNKRSFIDIGMKNEYFLGWGGEDNEILIRASLCQLKQVRIDDTLYHLYHDRLQIRTKNNVEQTKKIEQIKSKEDLLNVINKWPWVIESKENRDQD
ncbi:galactosyltransferase-related protein [Methanobacterium sp.]|uniref:galactosyltransferase-related protein n=1 Tax=Methanobacterium sp. TaxID=2164 RepID=UPI002ABB3788|nr:galactosyltransferase-related protein [Methanobacterium sp.]MDY9922506.1 galactosyltransferase-related protein [Methanobacterium sp.]